MVLGSADGVKSMATVTPRLPVAVCAVAAEAKRLLISKLATMTFWWSCFWHEQVIALLLTPYISLPLPLLHWFWRIRVLLLQKTRFFNYLLTSKNKMDLMHVRPCHMTFPWQIFECYMRILRTQIENLPTKNFFKIKFRIYLSGWKLLKVIVRSTHSNSSLTK